MSTQHKMICLHPTPTFKSKFSGSWWQCKTVASTYRYRRWR